MSVHNYAVLFGTVWAACLILGQAAHGQTAGERAQLSLSEALTRSLTGTPLLKAEEAARDVAEAGVRQADRKPNPSIDFLVENAVGTGLYQGLDRTEATLTYNQTLEWGGDREARTQLAVRQGERIRASGDLARQDLLYDVELAYINAQRAQADLAAAGIPATVIESVVLLTKTGGPLDAYYARIRENPVALAVKLADIADNSDPARQARLSPEVRERLTRKYAKAVAALSS